MAFLRSKGVTDPNVDTADIDDDTDGTVGTFVKDVERKTKEQEAQIEKEFTRASGYEGLKPTDESRTLIRRIESKIKLAIKAVDNVTTTPTETASILEPSEHEQEALAQLDDEAIFQFQKEDADVEELVRYAATWKFSAAPHLDAVFVAFAGIYELSYQVMLASFLNKYGGLHLGQAETGRGLETTITRIPADRDWETNTASK